MSRDRRHFQRVSFDAMAELATRTLRTAVQVVDLSFKGAMVELPADILLPPGTHCKLYVSLGEPAAGQTITMLTEVAHVDGTLHGLLCLGIDLDSITHLRRLIEVRLGSAELLEREFAQLIA